MLRRPCVLVLGVALSVATSFVAAPPALADAWADCPAHSLEDTTIRVFPRIPSPSGPTGTSSELQCGNRYYGFHRIEAEWNVVPDWRSAADAAIGRALTSDGAPVYDERSNTWSYRAPGVVVVLGPRGLIINARQEVP